ncbi:MAG TPA: hypothetical protein VGJ03_14640 [Acidimicrobiales bacterium]
MPVEPLPTIVQFRRRLATELLIAAARHSAVVDEVHDLDLVREEREWTAAEQARYTELRLMRADARRRHDQAARDLRRLMAGARVW